MQQSKISRRVVIRAALVAATLISGVERLAIAGGAALAPLDPHDPAAESIGFVTDTTQVDTASNPSHQATQKCGNCAQFQGSPGDALGGCNIFAGHSVPQGGWCKVWAQKPGT